MANRLGSFTSPSAPLDGDGNGTNGEDGITSGQGREKRRRITQSCNMCRKKRTKCDGVEPRCGPCSSRGLECTWAESKKRGPVPGKNVQARTQRLEAHLADLFHLVPGLEDLSMMVLGLSAYRPSQVLLAPHLPEDYNDIVAMRTHSKKHTVLRDRPVGKYFAEDQAEDSLPDSAMTPSQQAGNISLPPVGFFPETYEPMPQLYNPSDDSYRHKEEPMSISDIIQMMAAGQQQQQPPLEPYASTSQPSVAGSSYASGPAPNNGSAGQMGHILTPASTASGSNILPLHRNVIVHRNNGYVWEEDRDGGTCRLYGETSSFKQPPSLPITGRFNKSQIPVFPAQGQRTRLIDAYLSIIHPIMPMCSRAHLMQWSCSPNPGSDKFLQPELLFAVLANASFYASPTYPGSGTAQLQQAADMAASARTCLEASLSSPTIATVQTLVLLVLYDIALGDFTKAWADLGLLIGLAVDIGLPQSHEVLITDNPIDSAHSTTWYCVLILETTLCSLLGKNLILRSNTMRPLPADTGPDEWELWRSESVQSLEFSYGGVPSDPHALNTSPVQSFGIITPARTLSTFRHTIALLQWARQAIQLLNSGANQDPDISALKACLDGLETFKGNLSDIELSESSLSSIPQHRLDLYGSWLQWQILLTRQLSIYDNNAGALHDALLKQAGMLLTIKSRLYTHYRTSVLSIALPITTASITSAPDATYQAARASLDQTRRIFPDLVDRLRHATFDTFSASGTSTSLPEPLSYGYNASLTTPPFSAASSAPPHGSGGGQWHSMSFGSGDVPSKQVQDHGLAALLVSQTSLQQQADASSMAHAPPDNTYSLPYAAMQTFLDQVNLENGPAQTLDSSKIFDSASWAQTDVLSSLGFTNTPHGSPGHTGNEFSGLTGLLDRWNYSDGFERL